MTQQTHTQTHRHTHTRHTPLYTDIDMFGLCSYLLLELPTTKTKTKTKDEGEKEYALSQTKEQTQQTLKRKSNRVAQENNCT